VIADKLNQKKIDKKEIEVLKLFDLISFKKKGKNNNITDDLENYFLEKKIDKKNQKTTKETLNIFMKNHQGLNLLNLLKLKILEVEYYRLSNLLNGAQGSKSVMRFMNDVEHCKSNLTNKKIESIFQKYKKYLDRKYVDIDSFEAIHIYKEASRKIEPLIETLKQKVSDGDYDFIKSIDYSLLENKYTFYYILDHYMPIIQPFLNMFFKEMITESQFLHSDLLDKHELNKIDTYKKLFQKQKEKLIPKSFTDKFGINQDDILKVQPKIYELFSLLSPDILFEGIQDLFDLRKENKIGLASILYDFFLVTHRIHPVYEFYTEEEWWDEQDKKGNIPSNRKWKNHKLLRVKNIIPNF